MKQKFVPALLLLAALGSASAATYNIDPNHTYPSFEADHKGLSLWRGKFDKTSGTIEMDRAAKTGSMEVTIDANSLNFGLERMNSHAKSPDMFHVEKFPTMVYKGKRFRFEGEQLVEVEGELTMMGVTRPVNLKVNKFKCIIDQRMKREVCGADASAEFKRTDFGLNYATPAFAPEVRLAIQVEAIKAE